MLSSKPDKHEAKFAARIDVLTERVDTLASTVATTASAIAKKDGEIAALKRELELRDDAIRTLAARTAALAAPSEVNVDANELRSLRNAVASLTKERTQAVTAEHLEALAAKTAEVAQRVDALAATVASPGPPTAPDPGTAHRLAQLESELTSLSTQAEQQQAERDRHSEELRGMLGTLRTQVEALATLRTGAGDEETERRLAESEADLAHVSQRLDTLATAIESASASDEIERRVADGEAGLAHVSQRIDTLATTVEAAAASLGDKEHELAALHRHFTESSTRIEGIVEDIREALSAFSGAGSANVDDLTARIDRVGERLTRFEGVSRDTGTSLADGIRELEQRLETLEPQVSTVATEVARAKTLWPVALRSLEARLDDVAHPAPRAEPAPASSPAGDPAPEHAGDADVDLLAGLRDSLHAMETVAAEMARASDALPTSEDEAVRQAEESATAPNDLTPSDDTDPHQAVAAGGATIVPLRTADP